MPTNAVGLPSDRRAGRDHDLEAALAGGGTKPLDLGAPRLVWRKLALKVFIVIPRELYKAVQEGRVLVSGEVATADMRADAIQLAWKANGVREVLNEVEVGNTGGLRTYWTDSKIVRELEARMLLEREVSSLNYSVEAYNGTVFLLGVAQDQTELNRVLQLARNIGGVKKVVNHVLLRDDPRRFRAAPG
jgi:hypothetical protein